MAPADALVVQISAVKSGPSLSIRIVPFGTPVDMSKEFCSDKCKEERRVYEKRKTRNFVLITGAVLTFFIILLLLLG